MAFAYHRRRDLLNLTINSSREVEIDITER